ncbi:MAG: ATP-binding protein [Chlorobiota bacterium]|nr:ATP-binding protein [Chlorobiota bacterium]QQS67365.1 MAG: ATP-binding protein [Chlorobiota bacterium]
MGKLEVINWQGLRDAIEIGECENIEFKHEFSTYEKMAKEICAFANTRGGVILIGIDDNGRISGIESEKESTALIEHSSQFYCYPAVKMYIKVIEYNGLDVLIVNVPESNNKPHAVVLNNNNLSPEKDNRVYIRLKDKSVIASKEVTKVLEGKRADSPPLQIKIGWLEKLLMGYLEKNERITIAQFRSLANISQRRASRCLVHLVRAGVIRIFTDEGEDYYTLS